MVNRPNILAAASYYHSQMGWSFYPTRPRSKEPYTELLPLGINSKGEKRAVWSVFQQRQPDAAEIRAWYQIGDDANLALITGAISNLVIVEFDDEPGIAQFCGLVRIANLRELRTPLVQSRRGFHCYFQHPGFDVRGGLGIGCEVKGDGLSCTAPPSIHATGHLYKFLVTPSQAPLQPLPGIVIERLQENLIAALPVPLPPRRHQFDSGSAYGRKALQNAVNDLQATTHERHKKLIGVSFSIGRVVGAGAMDQATAQAALEYAAQSIGFTPTEARRVTRDGLVRGTQQPRVIEERAPAAPTPRRPRTLDQIRPKGAF